MRATNPRSILPAVEHLTEIIMGRFEGGLVHICRLRRVGFDVIPPYARVLAPPSGNSVTRIIAGGVGHPKQGQNNQDFQQFKCSTRVLRRFPG